ncbi:hypothetical protein [Streptomyces lydicus]|uniref:hypothetical protein n=1 Tax=Streptomyces lydicus TaxID=47763 RepID=UPI0019D71929|nr:hypothetical protein [Streptomyces lydicus]MCZ1012028.1 hypothetical protein [Streptomyces lydicus]
MNWAELLNALLVAGMVLPLLLRFLGLLSMTKAMAIQIAALTVATVWAFLQGKANDTVLFASVNMVLLLILRSDRDRDRDHPDDKGRAHDESRPRETDRAYDITTLKP